MKEGYLTMTNPIATEDLYHAYQQVFTSEPGKQVLEDLYRFCGFPHQSTFITDDPHGRESAFLEGRKDVSARIAVILTCNDLE